MPDRADWDDAMGLALDEARAGLGHDDVPIGAVVLGPDGAVLGYEDVFTKIDLCRAHYDKIGLGAGYVDQFIR